MLPIAGDIVGPCYIAQYSLSPPLIKSVSIMSSKSFTRLIAVALGKLYLFARFATSPTPYELNRAIVNSPRHLYKVRILPPLWCTL